MVHLFIKIQIHVFHANTAVTCTMDSSQFAVLALLTKSSKQTTSDEITLQGRDGVILLFNAEDPVPVATWFVNKVGLDSGLHFAAPGCLFQQKDLWLTLNI